MDFFPWICHGLPLITADERCDTLLLNDTTLIAVDYR